MTARQRLIHGMRSAIAAGLYYSGLLRLWQAYALRDRAVVLMYHRVLTADERRRAHSHPALVVDRDTFARQMAALRRHFRVLSVAEFAGYIERREPFPPSSCLVTFDDGWLDNFTNALPILAAHHVPALIFLPIDYIGAQRVFWQEALVQLLTRAVAAVRGDATRRPAIAAVLAGSGLDAALDVVDPDPKPALLAMVSGRKGTGRAALEALAAALADVLGVPPATLAASDGFIDWTQAATMRGQGVTFGGHGVDHHLLNQVPLDVAAAEIEGSKTALDRRFAEPVPTFSYPNGYWTPDVAALVRQAGYRLAFIAQGGPVRSTDDPYTLRRVNVHEAVTDSTPLFLARLAGIF